LNCKFCARVIERTQDAAWEAILENKESHVNEITNLNTKTEIKAFSPTGPIECPVDPIAVDGDGNCAAYAILRSAGLDTRLHLDLRIKLGNLLYSLEGDDLECLKGLSYSHDGEDVQTSIRSYIDNFKRNHTYFTHFELSILTKMANFGLSVYVNDETFVGERLIELWPEQPQLILPFREGRGGALGQSGHYNGACLQPRAKEILAIKLNSIVGIC